MTVEHSLMYSRSPSLLTKRRSLSWLNFHSITRLISYSVSTRSQQITELNNNAKCTLIFQEYTGQEEQQQTVILQQQQTAVNQKDDPQADSSSPGTKKSSVCTTL